MKRCPTCNKTYTDPNLSFCIEDGTPLVRDVSEESTDVSSSGRGETPAGPSVGAGDWKAPGYQPPGSYTPPGSVGPKRKVWPWVLGIVGVLIVGIVGIAVAAAILLPRMMRPSVDRNTPVSNANVGANDNERADLNANLGNKNSADVPTNTNTDTENSGDSAPPADADQVLAQLTDLENEWTVANLNADKKKLERILADDYVGLTPEGKPEGKAEYLRTIKRDSSVEKWDLDDLKVTLRGDRATLTGKITLRVEGKDVVYNFTDKFVWRDGRWQATSSQVALVQ